MVQITNLAKGPRGFHVKGVETKNDKSSAPIPVILRPGETADLDLHDEKHPVIQGMLDAGEITFGPVAASDKIRQDDRGIGPDFESMQNDELRAYIEDRMNGGKIEGNPERKALIAKARDMSSR